MSVTGGTTCDACIWQYGLPNESYAPYENWKVGGAARERPIFMKQTSTNLPDFLPVDSACGVTKLAEDQIRIEPLNSKTWKSVIDTYYEKLDKCYDKCQKALPCYGVNAVASYVDPQVVNKEDWDSDIYSYFYNENDECIDDCKKEVVLMKCYFYPSYRVEPKFRDNYAPIDKDYKIQGTRQFKLLGVDYEMKYPLALFSHYWTRRDYNLGPCTICTWIYGLPEFARKEVINAGESWIPATYTVSQWHNKILFQSHGTRNMTSLIHAVNVLSGHEVLNKPLNDAMWTTIETKYKKYLASCSNECNKSDECKSAFAVMKYISRFDLWYSDLDDDIIPAEAEEGVFFKCYGVNENYDYWDIDADFKRRSTYQWVATESPHDDRSLDAAMISTHIWHKTTLKDGDSLDN